MATYAGSSYASVPYASAPLSGGGPQVLINGGKFPLPVHEIALSGGAFDEPAVWTDVTPFVQRLKTKRGRQHELGRFEAGTAIYSLDNRGGEFSPFNTTGPFPANSIRPTLQVRSRMVYNGMTWPIFRGHIESWPQKWGPSPADANVEIHAVDAMKALNLKKAANLSTYAAAVSADGPVLWWRLGEAPGSAAAVDSSGNGRTGTTGTFDPTSPGNVLGTFGAAGAIVASPDTCYNLGTGYPMATYSGFNITATPLSLECWFNFPNVDGGGSAFPGLVRLDNPNVSPYFQNVALQFGYGSPGTPSANQGKLGGGAFDGTNGPSANTSSRMDDSVWHHTVLTISADGKTANLYVDGVLYSTNTVATGASFAAAPLARFVLGSGPGLIDEVAVYTTALTATQVANHFVAGKLPRLQELPGARINAYLDAISWPASMRRIDTGNTALQGADNTAVTQSLLANIQLVTDTEGGQLFVDTSGRVVFYDRLHTSASPNGLPAVVLGDSGVLGTEEPYLLEKTDTQYDELDIYNEVVVTPLGAGPQIAKDSASDTSYGTRTLPRTNLLMVGNDQALGMAQANLNQFKAPLMRTRAVSITPMSDPDVLFPAVLGFELLTRVNFRRRPLDGSASVFNQDALIEGIEHDIAPGEWTTTWHLSPTDATPIFWLIEDPVAGQIVENASVGLGY